MFRMKCDRCGREALFKVPINSKQGAAVCTCTCHKEGK